jgi:hypothetical protein
VQEIFPLAILGRRAKGSSALNYGEACLPNLFLETFITYLYIDVVFRKVALGYFVYILESLFAICIATSQWSARCD